MKRKITFILAICVALMILTVSCGQNQGAKKGNFTEIKAESTTTGMDISGYVADMLYGNIENWTLTAFEKNPGIVDQIKQGPDATYIEDVIIDNEKVINNVLKAGVDKNHGFEGKSALMISVYGSNVPAGITYRFYENQDISTGEYVLFYADAGEYTEREAEIGFSLKESDTEIWGLGTGKTYYLAGISGENPVEKTAKEAPHANMRESGRVVLAPGFKGWVMIPLSSFTIQNEVKSGDGEFKGNILKSMYIFAEGYSNQDYTSLYLSNFSFGSQNISEAKEFFDLSQFAYGDTNNADGWSMVIWFNEFTGKLLTGMTVQYMAKPSEELKTAGNNLVAALADAQKEDGYLGIYSEQTRFSDGNWDVWGHYHIIYGLVRWYRLTGNKQALEVAKKAADCVYNTFMGAGKTIDSIGNQTMNLAVCHGFAELYKETNNAKYLKAAKKIVVEEFPLSGNWYEEALEGKDFYQSSLPRWEALHGIMALGTLYEITGEKDYYTGLENIWWSIAKTDRHNTGGFSTIEQAYGDPYMEGQIETCCTVAWQALSVEYLQLSRNSIVADELEMTYFNAMLGSLLDGERLVTYNTPEGGKTRETSNSGFKNDMKFLFHSGARDFTCCQANAARGLGEVASWAVLTDKNAMYLNYYGPGKISGLTPDNQNITFVEETQYPLNGSIKITVIDLEKQENFKLAIRIPSWSKTSSVKLNGNEITGAEAGKYCYLEGTWKNGDVIEINLDVSFHVWVHEKEAEKASFYYGPILLAGISPDGLTLSMNKQLSYNDFKSATVSFANDGEHWLIFTVNTEKGKPYTFYDFASAGKYKAYRTWFLADDLPSAISPEKFGTPIWCS